jgi:hypothetical protein
MTDTTPEDAAPEDLDLGVAPQHVRPLIGKTTFERWHHPRKQEVRIEQWCAPVRALIRERKMTVGSTFRYLTLPGDEMLDIRALNGVCEREGIELRYLGFNSVSAGTPRQAELNLSQSEVLDLKGISRFSTVIEERLEAIARADSLAFHRMRQHGPFDAINIDLCNALTEREADDHRGSPLGVLGQLLATQLTTTKPWLLFVTTLAQPGLITTRNRAGFQEAIDANIAASTEFASGLAECIAGLAECISPEGDLSAQMEAVWGQQDPAFLRLFSTGLGKWLLRILSGSAPQRRLSLLNSYYYQVGPDGPDMLSLAFRCDTVDQPVQDQSGILPVGPPAPALSEVDLAIELTQKLKESKDLDYLLAHDEERAEKRLQQAMTLMGAARFSPQAYEAWARSELRRARAAFGLELEAQGA